MIIPSGEKIPNLGTLQLSEWHRMEPRLPTLRRACAPFLMLLCGELILITIKIKKKINYRYLDNICMFKGQSLNSLMSFIIVLAHCCGQWNKYISSKSGLLLTDYTTGSGNKIISSTPIVH